ncbi:MAG: NAD-dependent epimerase/dehydratase family protein, partial [Bacteriovoracaceae bacterium]|nr:NAD-dependent epimerase/dehydratase family protein [Bacteriovoracaceae bacterium]
AWIFDNLFKDTGVEDKEFDNLIKNENVHFVKVDLNKEVGKLDVPDSYDLVFHLAAINGTRLFYEIPYQVATTNLRVTLNFYKWLEDKKIGRLIYSSTSEVYSGAEKVGLLEIPTCEAAPVVFSQPTDVRYSYGTSKFMGEFLTLHFSKQFNTETSVIRYHNIYGPRMGNKHVIPEFMIRMKGGETPFNLYGGEETRSFCYVNDAIEATFEVGRSAKCAGEIIHIGNSSIEIKISDLAKAMMQIMKVDYPIVENGSKSSSVKRRCPDTSKLNKLTGFTAKISLEQGLEETLDWYSKNY